MHKMNTKNDRFKLKIKIKNNKTLDISTCNIRRWRLWLAAEEQVVADFVWQSGEYLGSHLRHHTGYVAALMGRVGIKHMEIVKRMCSEIISISKGFV